MLGSEKRNEFPRGAGIFIGSAIGISLFALVGVTLGNLGLGIACLISGIAMGMAIEGPFD
jgi:hypothetical protein